jgi:hypothetical protein
MVTASCVTTTTTTCQAENWNKGTTAQAVTTPRRTTSTGHEELKRGRFVKTKRNKGKVLFRKRKVLPAEWGVLTAESVPHSIEKHLQTELFQSRTTRVLAKEGSFFGLLPSFGFLRLFEACAFFSKSVGLVPAGQQVRDHFFSKRSALRVWMNPRILLAAVVFVAVALTVKLAVTPPLAISPDICCPCAVGVVRNVSLMVPGVDTTLQLSVRVVSWTSGVSTFEFETSWLAAPVQIVQVGPRQLEPGLPSADSPYYWVDDGAVASVVPLKNGGDPLQQGMCWREARNLDPDLLADVRRRVQFGKPHACSEPPMTGDGAQGDRCGTLVGVGVCGFLRSFSQENVSDVWLPVGFRDWIALDSARLSFLFVSSSRQQSKITETPVPITLMMEGSNPLSSASAMPCSSSYGRAARAVGQFKSFKMFRVWARVLERLRGTNFDYLVKMRPDMSFGAPLPRISNLTSNAVVAAASKLSRLNGIIVALFSFFPSRLFFFFHSFCYSCDSHW